MLVMQKKQVAIHLVAPAIPHVVKFKFIVMALNDALKFIEEIKKSSEFRGYLYQCDTPDEVKKKVISLGYNFTYPEFEDSYRKQLLACQFEEDANLVKEVFGMYRMLLGMSPEIL
jgi:F0F1-type ATP synthase delta subunit